MTKIVVKSTLAVLLLVASAGLTLAKQYDVYVLFYGGSPIHYGDTTKKTCDDALKGVENQVPHPEMLKCVHFTINQEDA